MQPPNAADRPQVLSAAFQSVAELGQVFRDQPWKTLNFTTADYSNPPLHKSADAGLLDAFTLQEVIPIARVGTVVAGKTSLNSTVKPALLAILSQATRNLAGVDGNGKSTVLNSAQCGNIVNALMAQTASAPMLNRADLVTWLEANTNVSGLGNKEARECVLRAFSDATQTRTWNLMIDVIAQSGRYPPTAKTLADFIVEGEKRYWLHIAIDRFTGEVIDQQLEAVYE
jgi:hypothetical protein